MDSAAIQKYLLQLFERHDVELEPDDDGWLLTDGDFPAIRASWHEGTSGEPGRLDVDVVVGEDRCIEDSFAGAGDGEAGCRDALKAFEQASFPLLLAACWYITDDRRMRIGAWDIGVRTWDVFVGPLLLRAAQTEEQSMPPEVAIALQSVVGQLSLAPELHWIHLLHRRDADGVVTHEALLDNEPWAAGSQALASMAWPELPTAATARQMILLDVRDY